jgi:Ni,Fe-hydrogenase III large subunit/Ni,Fe-hydrogenase III component G
MSEEYLTEIVEDLPPDLAIGVESTSWEGKNLRIDVNKDTLAGMVAHLNRRYHVTLISQHAADEREFTSCFCIYTIFSLPRKDLFLTLATRIQESLPAYRTLTSEVFAAYWYEREIMDMFGITATGHPDPRPLVLWDDWPLGYYPLRKDFDIESKVERIKTDYPYRPVEGEGVFVIPVGPVHAGVIEPGHFRFSVAGEPIINLEIRLGYVHRGVEKISEATPYHRGVFLAERISGDNGFAHSTAYCQAVESIADVQVPERAECIRTALLELERIYNHIGDLGGIALDTAFNVGAQQAYILKERMMDLNDWLTGSRFLRSVNKPGGVRKDISKEQAVKINSTLIRTKLDLTEWVQMITNMPSLMDRIEVTGTISYDIAKNMDLVGPAARGSGVDRDVRRDHPYAAYKRMSFTVPVYREGDILARTKVRIDEIYESMSIIEQALEAMSGSEIATKLGDVPEKKVGMGLVEAPRGEAMHWMMAGQGVPLRHKVRDPSFSNWLAIEFAVLGNIVPDFPLVNKSLSLSYAGNDL